MSNLSPKGGNLLVAEPLMLDPNFRRTVVLLCDHSEEGSFGLTLGEYLEYSLSEVLEFGGPFDARLRLGGPVEQNTLHVVHRREEVPHAVELHPGVYWGGDYTFLIDLIETESVSPDEIAFFLGYAGWGPGQLEEELAGDDWMVSTASPELVFESDPDVLWRTVLRQMGGNFALLSNFPDDPSLN